jgi:glycerophosphoryl diester phosphodiesterase
VRMSKDGKTVLYHDKTLYKINRTRKRISDHTYNELCSMDWGAWFSPEYKNEPLLTLAETLSLYAHRTKLMIEIKSDPADRKSGRHLELADAVLTELDTPKIRKHLDNIYVLSFDSEVLKYAYQKSPKIRYVLNLSEDDSPTSFKHILTQPRSEINYLYALCVNKKYLSEELVEFCRKLKKQIMTYSCNTLKQLNRVMSLTADSVMTDKPRWLIDLKH